jgi:folate-binding Fe-S cluster repair protein YgfZ
MTATRLFDRAVLRLSPQEAGEDVAGFLQGLVTSDMKGPLPVWTGLLTAQGKALFDFIVWRDGDDLLVDCEAGAADALAKRLSLYRLRRKIAIARDESLAVHWSPAEGEHPDPRLAALGQRWLAPPIPPTSPPTPCGARTGWRWACPKARTNSAATRRCGWKPTPAISTASASPRAATGQENTARMNWRQKVNRRLVVVPLDRSDEARRRVAYPDLGLAVDHLRVEDLPADLAPAWMTLATEGAGED